jgi:hypothetical protein
LLDFSDDPLVAAYFAALGCLKDEKTEGRMAIWCFPDRLITDQFPRSGYLKLPLDWRLKVVTAPTAMNANLRAQRGLFLLDCKPDESGTLQNPSNLLDALPSDSNPVIKIEVPHSEARELLKLLKHHGKSTAALFPTAEGVARAMEEDQTLTQL